MFKKFANGDGENFKNLQKFAIRDGEDFKNLKFSPSPILKH